MNTTDQEQIKPEAERCRAYAEHWQELGMSEGWEGCSLPKGHEGDHKDEHNQPTS